MIVFWIHRYNLLDHDINKCLEKDPRRRFLPIVITLSLIASLSLLSFCLLYFLRLGDHIINLPASEHLPEKFIIPDLLSERSVLFFEPVISSRQGFVLLLQLSIPLVKPVILIDHLEITHQKILYKLFQAVDKRLCNLGFISLGCHKS